ncbi:hypothetical protein ACS0TY_002671 [Phlomoides rotata]
MASSTAPTQDSNATPCFQSPVDGTPQTMSVDEIPTPNDSNQIKGKWKAECNFCKKQLGGDTKNGTRHLHDHLRICPFKNTRDIMQSILMPKKDTGGKFSVGTYTFNEEIVRKDLASMIVLHEYPLSMVEHFGFRRFLSSLQPLFKVVFNSVTELFSGTEYPTANLYFPKICEIKMSLKE